MRQSVTRGIVLSRTDYGEADRILTLLTPDYGKLRLMARGVRRIKSKLAGGIELFSVSDITFIRGRGEIGTLVSSRLRKYYGNIVKNIDRTMLGYELIKMLGQATEDQLESEYFYLLEQAFAALDDSQIDSELIRVWFAAQLLRFSGHTPNLRTDTARQKLQAEASYDFSFDDSTFAPSSGGNFRADDIKFLRLLFSGSAPNVLAKVAGGDKLVAKTKQLVLLMQQQYIH